MRAVIVWLIKGGFNSPIFAPFKSGHKPTFNGEKWVILGSFPLLDTLGISGGIYGGAYKSMNPWFYWA